MYSKAKVMNAILNFVLQFVNQLTLLCGLIQTNFQNPF